MQDLTGRFPMALAPTSQEGGGLVDHGQGQAAMTAPGSVPVTPMPPPADGPVLPMPQVSGTTIPLSHVQRGYHGDRAVGDAARFRSVQRGRHGDRHVGRLPAVHADRRALGPAW